MNTIPSIFTVLASMLVACVSAVAQVPDAVVQSLSAPDRVETRVGPLEFKDGLPTGATSNAVRTPSLSTTPSNHSSRRRGS